MAATAALALGIAAMIAVHATYQGQDERGIARNPITREDRPDLPATVRWSMSQDHVPGSGTFYVIFIAPMTADAPLPPGLSAWPAPGEAVLSPRLQRIGANDGITSRYGRTVGQIGVEGLQSPDELLAYVRPRADLPLAKLEPVVGYGRPPRALPINPGQLSYAQPEWVFQLMLGGLVLLPVAVLLVVAARSGSHNRDRRTALVDALGGTSRSRALIVLGEVSLPVLSGSAFATAVLAGFWATDVRLPVTGFVVSADDLRARWWELLSAVVTAAVLVVLASVVAGRLVRARGKGNRPAGARRSTTRWAVLCPVFLLVAVRGPEFFPTGTAGNVLTNWFGAAGTLVTLPAVVAVLTAQLGRQMSRAGRRLGRAGLLVAGQRTFAHPGPVARMTAAVVVSLGLLIQVVAWQGLFGEPARAARTTADRVGSSALVVSTRSDATPRQMDAFVRALPRGVHAVQLITDLGRNTTTLQGTCRGLTTLQLPCDRQGAVLKGVPKDQRVREIIDWNGLGAAALTVREAPRGAGTEAPGEVPGTILVSVDGRDLSVPELKQLSYQLFTQGASIHTPGGEWLVTSEITRAHGLWIGFFGVIGILVLAGASVVSGTAEFLRNGRALAPVSTLSGNRRIYWSTAAWSLLVPFVLAGGAGCLIGTWLAYPKTFDGASYISESFLVACALGVSAMGLLAWVWGANVAARQAATWQPRGE
ncbi:ABC transporter permease [Streptomyces sp. NPDC006482]|uniref:ABC transporter permease n=1 Tax=Streptomyces sp. NPDC006482 TaxID=3154306 RepID=UPI0033B691D6